MARAITVCVFCGSRFGDHPKIRRTAERLGALLGAQGIEMVYGGGHVGLMGALSDAALEAGGRVIGISPERVLESEGAARPGAELIITRDLFERKAQMIARSDAFLALPGGLGTLDELLEVITLRQLGYHDKPILLVDLHGYWAPFVRLVEHLMATNFAAADVRHLFRVIERVEDVPMALKLRPKEPAAAIEHCPPAAIEAPNVPGDNIMLSTLIDMAERLDTAANIARSRPDARDVTQLQILTGSVLQSFLFLAILVSGLANNRSSTLAMSSYLDLYIGPDGAVMIDEMPRPKLEPPGDRVEGITSADPRPGRPGL